MKVAVGSMWRDSMSYIDTALAQYDEFARLLHGLGHDVSFVFVEGDSIDDTPIRLKEFADTHRVELVTRSDGCRYFPSADDPDRWRHLAWCSNGTLEHIPDDADVFVYVESDLLWNPADMLRLVSLTEQWPVVAAANVHPDGRWYDIWGTAIDGENFTSNPPHHPRFTGDPIHVDSAAGCTAMRAAIARATRFQPEDCYRGWCRDIRSKGWDIVLNPSIRVVHPPR